MTTRALENCRAERYHHEIKPIIQRVIMSKRTEMVTAELYASMNALIGNK